MPIKLVIDNLTKSLSPIVVNRGILYISEGNTVVLTTECIIYSPGIKLKNRTFRAMLMVRGTDTPKGRKVRDIYLWNLSNFKLCDATITISND